MFNTYETTKSILSNVDYSTFNYKKPDDIDFSRLDLSSVPSVDLTKVDSIISSLIDEQTCFKDAVLKSRINEAKQKSCLATLDYIGVLIDTYNNPDFSGDKDSQRYKTASSLCGYLENISRDVPASIKPKVKSYHRDLTEVLDSLYRTVRVRESVFYNLTETILKESEKYRVNKFREELDVKGVTREDIENCKEYKYLDAVSGYVSDKFGAGASDMIRAILYAKKYGNARPELDFTFSDRVENIINCARYFGVKEFSFEGDSTACLSTLFILTKLGLSFKIEEVTSNRCYSTETRPVVIVTL